MIEIFPDMRVLTSLSPIDFGSGINRLEAIATELFSLPLMRDGLFFVSQQEKY